ncbi:hypothetical protein CEP07_12830 [Cylindrospermopsis raciborskii S01]|nr:hypothetical protein CEP07_12830 [Cylindrospermopsis raciborskii S01]
MDELDITNEEIIKAATIFVKANCYTPNPLKILSNLYGLHSTCLDRREEISNTHFLMPYPSSHRNQGR